MLNHRGIGDISVIVIRYFGGIKLGAGGLVRAYGSATQQAIEQLVTALNSPKMRVTLRCAFSLESSLRRHLSTLDGQIDSVDYAAELTLCTAIPYANIDALKAFCAARADIVIDRLDG